jgi:hypothetical protein
VLWRARLAGRRSGIGFRPGRRPANGVQAFLHPMTFFVLTAATLVILGLNVHDGWIAEVDSVSKFCFGYDGIHDLSTLLLTF